MSDTKNSARRDARLSQTPPIWRNWARTVTSTPREVMTASCEADIVAAVASARRRGLRIKAIGSGHSYNDIADTSHAICLALSSHRGIEHIDRRTLHVTAWAGMTLAALCEALSKHGLALPVLGAITDQTLAGLVSTATHGTGLTMHSLSDYVVGVRFVDGNADIVELKAGRDQRLLLAVRVGLGALGILSTVTFACIPSYDVALQTRPALMSEVTQNLAAYQTADYFGFWWFPQTPWVSLRIARRLPPASSYSMSARTRRYTTLPEKLHETALWIGGGNRRGTAVINHLQRALWFRRERVERGRWDVIFPCPSPIRQVAMEYALPIEATTAALSELSRIFRGFPVHAPVDVRFGAADEAWLSPSNGRRTCYIGVAIGQPFRRTIAFEALFGQLEAVFAQFAGRPHWGKMHSLEAEQLQSCYPRWNQFMAARALFDKNGLFGNAHLHNVLGDYPVRD